MIDDREGFEYGVTAVLGQKHIYAEENDPTKHER